MMDDYEGRQEVEQSLADVEHQLVCVQDYLGLDARHPRVKDFIKCVTEFSPWVKEELEKIADLKSRKKNIEEKMDQLAIEGFKIRLSRKFTQIEMAERAKVVRDYGAQVLGLNEKINNITANIHDKAGGVSELLEDAAQYSYNAPASNMNKEHNVRNGISGRGASARGTTPSTSIAPSRSVAVSEQQPNSRKKRRTSGQVSTDAAVENRRDVLPAPPAMILNAASNAKPSSLAAAMGSTGVLPIDPAEPLYCLCRQVSYGEMIACDNPLCKYEWFHFGCVKITEQPSGKWYCPLCRDYMTKQNGFFDQYTSRVDMTVAEQVMREHSHKYGSSGGNHQHGSGRSKG